MLLLYANIFQPLIDVFESVIKFFHNSLGIQWGWSIVLLTVVMRALLLPLTIKQFHSMQALQRHAPELKAIQQKYKDDKQRQQQEMMKFYRENNVNPLASCLPLALQLPVFISLFYMLRTSLRRDICPIIQTKYQAMQATAYAHLHGVSLKAAVAATAGQTTVCGPGNGAHLPASPAARFLFIPDLTNHATGAVLIVLLLLYVGTQLASSLVMQSPTMDRNQRLLMLFLPLVFVFIVIGFPAGVLVYWITTNVWTIGQQLIIKRRIGPTPVAAAALASGAGGGGGLTASEPAVKEGPKLPGSGLGALLRGQSKGAPSKGAPSKGASASINGASARSGGPPPSSPRKRKKRSGRRR